MSTQDDLFHPVVELPEPIRADRYQRLVGLNEVKSRLRKEAILLADPDRLRQWADKHHTGDVPALTLFRDRAPLFLFAGDVGSGKSALAESFGCDLAEELDLPVCRRSRNFRSLDHRNSLGSGVFGGRCGHYRLGMIVACWSMRSDSATGWSQCGQRPPIPMRRAKLPQGWQRCSPWSRSPQSGHS